MSPWLKLYVSGLLLLLGCARPAEARQAPALVRDVYRAGDFELARGRSAADVLVSEEDFKVVRIAAADLAADVERVTGARPSVRSEAAGLSRHAVVVGTLGKSPFIDRLARAGKLDAEGLRGRWESFLITTVKDPLPGVRLGLVVAGSDRRGTAYGVYELSQAAGVSPWHWWADVTPARRRLRLFRAGEFELTFYLVPTHPVRGSRGLRFAYSLGGAEPRELAASAGVEVTSKEWSQNVLNNVTKTSARVRVGEPGAHVLRVYMLDPGVVLDKIVLNTGGLRPSYLGPPETRVVLK